MTDADVVHLELINDVGVIASLREAADAMGIRAGFTETRRLDVQLALEEVAANVIEHAGLGRNTFWVRLARTGSCLEAVVEDEGEPFDPLSAPAFDPTTPLEARRPGGWGIHLVRQLTDGVSYTRTSNRNILRLMFHPRQSDPCPPAPNPEEHPCPAH
jgi:anti-sigma regulatory factor (Ser/Thr protein kinase)